MSAPELLPVAPLERLRQRRSAKWRMHPADVLPLSIAEMDFDLAEPITRALRAAIDRSDTGYAGATDEVAQAYAAFAARTWDWAVDPGAVTAVTDVGVGVVELLRVLDPTRVVVCSPVYPPFFDWVAETGAELVDVPLHHTDAGWRLDLDRLDDQVRPGDVILLCNPHNPVGTIHDQTELTALVELATRHGITVIGDEIHAPLALPGHHVTPILTIPGAPDIAFSVTSASKAWNLAGLKCALVVTASPTSAATVQQLPPDTRWRVGHLGAIATTAAFTSGAEWHTRLIATLDHRRTLLGDLLAERLPELRWTPPDASYLAWLDCAAHGTGTDVTRTILDTGRVAVEAGDKFGAAGHHHVRLNFATSPEILDQAIARIAAALR